MPLETNLGLALMPRRRAACNRDPIETLVRKVYCKPPLILQSAYNSRAAILIIPKELIDDVQKFVPILYSETLDPTLAGSGVFEVTGGAGVGAVEQSHFNWLFLSARHEVHE